MPSIHTPQEQEELTRGDRVARLLWKTLRLMEHVIAAVTLVLLALSLVYELVMIFQDISYFSDASLFLNSLLSIVVGLEFVKMLVDTNPESILEVLIVAITRYIILSHDDPWKNLVCIVCIAGLFAIDRFLIPHPKEKNDK